MEVKLLSSDSTEPVLYSPVLLLFFFSVLTILFLFDIVHYIICLIIKVADILNKLHLINSIFVLDYVTLKMSDSTVYAIQYALCM